MEHAREAREIFERAGDRLRLARLDANVGNILYRQDRFEEALELYQRAYQTFVEIGEPQDIAISLKNTATCQISLNNFPRSAGDLSEGPLLLRSGTYARAGGGGRLQHRLPLLPARRVHAIHRTLSRRAQGLPQAGRPYREALCDLDQSEMYLELNLSEEGAHLAGRAQKAFLALGMGYEAAKAQTNLAISLTHHGELAGALELFHRARQLFDEENNRAWIATIDLYQALVHHRERRLDEALELCRRALDFFEPSPLFTKSVLCRFLLARILSGSRRDAKRPGEPARLRWTASRRLEHPRSATRPGMYSAWWKNRSARPRRRIRPT